MRTSTSTSITAIDPAAWDALVGDGAPFLRHAFLAGLESSGCVGGQTGWTPAPITLRDDRGLAAAAPAYIKAHSFGEFVFDFSWAQAYAQHGLEYYPKLVIGVPFTPATAPRLLVRPDLDAAVWRARLVAAIEQFATERALSSAHGLFVSPDDGAAFDAASWLARSDVQFHWTNQGYADYEAFLETFTTKFRKNARRERRRVAEAGVTCETLLGPALDQRAIDEVYELHRDTFLRHGHEPYLTRAFFRQLPAALGESLLVKRARHDGRTVAVAVFYWNRDALYGRYWGTSENFHSLHFELCYHQGIDFCIERGITRFEPGTQGEHKVSRGFVPTRTASRHWIVDERFRDAIGDYLEREGAHVESYAEEINRHVPYRNARREAREVNDDK
jgi:predicted N-acyltransferase